MLAKFDSKSYFNPHSLVIYTRWDKLSFLGKNTYGKIVENNQPSLPFWKTNLKTKLNILIIQTSFHIKKSFSNSSAFFCNNSWRLKAVNYFRKTLYLRRLAGFWLRFSVSHFKYPSLLWLSDVVCERFFIHLF